MTSILDVARALTCYDGFDGAELNRIGTGLINETYAVRFGPRRFILQRVSPIFDPTIHLNIAAVTEHLAAAGIETPRLVRTTKGELCATLDDIGVWRLMTYVDGVSFDKVQSPAQAAAAAELVGRVHTALDDLVHEFAGMRPDVHNTEKHIAALETAVNENGHHRLITQVGRISESLLQAAREMPPLPVMPNRVCHGDLKISNVLFAGWSPPASVHAVSLIDLDTLGPMMLAHELGDAWRSWCNPAREDDSSAAAFDLAIFESSWLGYLRGLGRTLTRPAREALLLGPEWVSLELAIRFAADALLERYFGWDEARFSDAGEHNLIRARGQWALFRAIRDARRERQAILGLG